MAADTDTITRDLPTMLFALAERRLRVAEVVSSLVSAEHLEDPDVVVRLKAAGIDADERAAEGQRLLRELEGYAGPAMRYIEEDAPIPERLVAVMEDAHRAAQQFATDTLAELSRLGDLIDEGEAARSAVDDEEARRHHRAPAARPRLLTRQRELASAAF